METVTLHGGAAGHGINISDSHDDGVVVGGIDHGSPAHQSDRIARGDKIVSLTIDAADLSPGTLRKILDSASAYPVRLDVKGRGESSPNAVVNATLPPVWTGVDVGLPSTAVDAPADVDVGVNGVGPVDGPAGYVKVVGTPKDIGGPGVHVPRRSLNADVEFQSPAATVDLESSAPIEDGGISVDVGDKGLMAELDKMFEVDAAPFTFDGPQLHAGVNGEMDSKLELPSAKTELDVNADPSMPVDAVLDADADVIVEVKASKVKSEPPAADIDFTTPEVEIGTARIADVNADKNLHVGDSEVSVKLPDLPATNQDIEVKGPRAMQVSVEVDTQLDHTVDKDIALEPGGVVGELPGVAVKHQPLTIDVSTPAAAAEVDLPHTPRSPTGYVKVVSPITAGAPKMFDNDVPSIEVTVDDKELKKEKRTSLGSKFRNLFKGDQPAEVKATGKVDKDIELLSPTAKVSPKRPDSAELEVTSPEVFITDPYLELTKPFLELNLNAEVHKPRLSSPRSPKSPKGKVDAELHHSLDANLPATDAANIDVGMEHTLDINLEADADKVKAEHGLPSADVEIEAPKVHVEASSPQVYVPSVGIEGKTPDLDGVEVNLKSGKDVGDFEGPSVSADVDVPQLHVDHGKPAADVDVDVSSKDGQKKSKLRFPFRSKSKKKDVEAKVELPTATIEISHPIPIVEADKANAGVEVPTGEVSAVVAVPSLDINLEADKVKAEHSLPAADVEIEAPKVHVEASSPEVDVPSLGIEGKTPGIDGVEVGLKSGKDVGDLEGPSVTASVDVPQLHVDHGKPAADVDVDVSGKDGHKKTKLRFPFRSKSKKKDVEAKVELPTATIEISHPIPIVEADKANAGVQVPARELSAVNAVPSLDINLEADKVKADHGLPAADVEIEAPKVHVEASSPEVDVPSLGIDGKTQGIDGVEVASKSPEIDVELQVKTDKDVCDLDGPSVSAFVDVPQLHFDHGKPPADVDVDVSTKDGKKKTKLRFPFKTKSKKNDVEGKVELPTAAIEISHPIPIVEADKANAGVEIPAGEVSAVGAVPSLDINLEADSEKVKAEHGLPSADVEIEAPKVHAEASAPEVNVPSLGMEGKTPGIGGVEVASKSSETDVGLHVKTDKDVGDLDGPLVSACVDVPQLHVDHGKPAADVDIDVSAKDTKKKSKLRFPFKSKSKKNDVEGNVELPTAAIEISHPIPIVEADKANAGVEIPAGEVSVVGAVPSLDINLEADSDKVKAEHGLPGADVEIEAPKVHVEASTPEVDVPSLGVERKHDSEVPKVSVDTKLDDMLGIRGGELDLDLDASELEIKPSKANIGLQLTPPSPELNVESEHESVEVPAGRISVEKSQEAFKTAADMSIDIRPVPSLDAQLGPIRPVRMSVEKCEEDDTPFIAVEGNANLSTQAPTVEVKPVSTDAQVDDTKKSGRGLFGIFGKKDKKKEKEKKIRGPSVEMKTDVHLDDEQVRLDSAGVSGDTDEPKMELNVALPDVEIKHDKDTDVMAVKPTVVLDLAPHDFGDDDVEVPEVRMKSQAALHAEVPRLSDGTGRDVEAGLDSWNVDVNANKIDDKEADVNLDDVHGPAFGAMSVDITAASPQLDVGQPDISAAGVSLDADITAPSVEISKGDASQVTLDVQTEKLASPVDLPEAELKAEVPGKSVHFSNEDTHIGVDVKSAPAADVDVDVSGKDGKKKSKLRFPFRSKSKKKDVDAKVVSPTAAIEISHPIPIVEPEKANAGVEIPAGEVSVVGAVPSLDLNLEPDADKVKAEHGLPAADVEIEAPKVHVEASAPEVDMPSLGIEEKTPGIDGVEVASKSPEIDVGLQVKTDKDVGDLEGPSVSACVDVPQLHVDHGKPPADVDVDVSAKVDKKKSKLRFPFKSKSKKKDIEAVVELPTAAIEISHPMPIVEDDKGNAGVEVPAGEVSVVGTVPSIDINLEADADKVKAEHGFPSADAEIEAPRVHVEASAPEVNVPSLGIEGKTPGIGGVEVASKSPETDVGVHVKTDKDVGDLDGPSVSACVDVPQLHVDHGKPAANVDIDVSDKDTKKKSKLRFPFKSKSKQNDAEGKVELPTTAIEISHPIPIVEVDKANAGVEIPAGEVSVVGAVPSLDINLEGDADKVKAEHGLPAAEVEIEAPKVHVEASAPEVDVPSLGIEGKTPGIDGVEVASKPPEIDVGLQVKTEKDVGDLEGPSVSACVDVPQLHVDHGKPPADVDVDVPAKVDKKKSKLRFPFKSKSKKKDIEAVVELPTAAIEISHPMPIVEDDKGNVGVEIPAGEVSVVGAVPSLDINLEADSDKVNAEHGLPAADVEIEAPKVHVEASAPEVDLPSLGIDGKTPDIDGVEVASKSPEIEVGLQVKTEKDVGDLEGPLVSACVDVPQLHVDHGKPPADVDVDVSTKDDEKESKLRFPFKPKGNKDDVEAKVELPAVGIEVWHPMPMEAADTKLDANVDPAKAEHSLPGVELSALALEVGASAPEVDVPVDGMVTSEEADDIHGPSVRAGVDIPQFSADLSPENVPGADLSVQPPALEAAVSAEAPEISSKLSADQPDAKDVKQPQVDVDVPETKPTVISVDVDPTLAGDVSVAKPDAAATIDGDIAVSLDGGKAGVEIPEQLSISPEEKMTEASVNASLPAVSPDAQISVTADEPSGEFSVAGLGPSVDTSPEADIVPVKAECRLPGVEFTAPELQVDAPSPEVDVPSLPDDGKTTDLAGIHFDVQPPEIDADEPSGEFSVAGLGPPVDVTPEVDIVPVKAERRLPGVEFTAPELQVDAPSPEVDVPSLPDDGKTPDLAGIHFNVPPPEIDADGGLDVPISVDGEVSVPAISQSDRVPEDDARSSGSGGSSRRSSQVDQDASELPEVECDDDIDDVIVKVSVKPVSASLPPGFEVGSDDEEPADGSWWDFAPTSQRDRCVRRTEPFQKHGYAVLVTPTMLKLQGAVHDDLQNGRAQLSADSVDDGHDQEDDPGSSSSDSERLSGQYYYGISSFNADVAESDHTRDDGKGHPPPTGSDDADQPLTDGRRL